MCSSLTLENEGCPYTVLFVHLAVVFLVYGQWSIGLTVIASELDKGLEALPILSYGWQKRPVPSHAATCYTGDFWTRDDLSVIVIYIHVGRSKQAVARNAVIPVSSTAGAGKVATRYRGAESRMCYNV